VSCLKDTVFLSCRTWATRHTFALCCEARTTQGSTLSPPATRRKRSSPTSQQTGSYAGQGRTEERPLTAPETSDRVSVQEIYILNQYF